MKEATIWVHFSSGNVVVSENSLDIWKRNPLPCFLVLNLSSQSTFTTETLPGIMTWVEIAFSINQDHLIDIDIDDTEVGQLYYYICSFMEPWDRN